MTILRRRRADRLERLERAVLGLALVAGVVWAVTGGHAPGLLSVFSH